MSKDANAQQAGGDDKIFHMVMSWLDGGSKSSERNGDLLYRGEGISGRELAVSSSKYPGRWSFNIDDFGVSF